MSLNKTNKLKVLMVNHEFPPIGGGGGTTTRFLAKSLIRQGVEVSILTAKPGLEKVCEHPDGFKIYYVGPTKTKIQTSHIPEMTRFILSILFIAKNISFMTKPDLVHCFFSIPAGCFGLYCKKKFNLPYITSALGADVPGFDIGDWRLNVYHAVTNSLTKAIWGNSSYLVANSPSLKELCKRFSPNQNIEIITNGVDSSVFYPRSNLGNLNKDKIIFLFVGRLIWQKGIECLIEACRILKLRGNNNFELNIVGDGHLKGKIFSLINKYQINEKINFLGWQKLEALPDIYRSSDVFILPSSMEGMPSVALQAMSCGLPIITTKVAGFEELLSEGVNGLSAGYNKPGELADCMEMLLKSREIVEKMSKASIEKAQKYRWDNIASKYLELYEKIASVEGQARTDLQLALR